MTSQPLEIISSFWLQQLTYLPLDLCGFFSSPNPQKSLGRTQKKTRKTSWWRHFLPLASIFVKLRLKQTSQHPLSRWHTLSSMCAKNRAQNDLTKCVAPDNIVRYFWGHLGPPFFHRLSIALWSPRGFARVLNASLTTKSGPIRPFLQAQKLFLQKSYF